MSFPAGDAGLEVSAFGSLDEQVVALNLDLNRIANDKIAGLVAPPPVSLMTDKLRDDRVTISRAFLWAKMSPKDQCKALLEWGRNRAARGVIRLVRRRSRSEDATAPDAVTTVRALGNAMTAAPEEYPVTILRIEGRGIFITHELAISLTNEKDSLR